MMKELIEKKLIPNTWITDYQLENNAFVLEHEKITRSNPSMWSFEMFKDAALISAKVSISVIPQFYN